MTYIPKVCGTCMGSSLALNLVNTIYEREKNKTNPKKIVIYKDILHNKKVIEDLQKKGIVCIKNLNEVKKDNIVILRAHGEAKKTYDYLEKNNIEYYDATCMKVSRIHDIIKEKYEKNYDIVIIGQKDSNNKLHAEVEGSNGWCDDKAIIVSNEEDLEKIIFKNKNVLVICQSTFSKDYSKKLYNQLKEKYQNINFEFENTICNVQSIIQRESEIISKQCDYMIVLGGKNSANTKELFNKCNKNCKSFHCETLEEVFEIIKEFKSDSKIGITGGASTPQKQIEECRDLIEFYQFYLSEKKKFENEIEKYNLSFLQGEKNKILSDSINKFININKNGKYIRAILISLGYKMFGGTDDNYIPLAIAYETFQTSILVHDDIIDDATLRRGVDTIPVTYLKEFSKKDKALANSLGLCIGDLGFFYTNKILVENYGKNKYFSDLFEYYNNIVINTIKGEILDVKLPYDVKNISKENLTEENVMDIYRLKTAWYTIVGPFGLGAILSGSKEKFLKFHSILENIGIAFQIKDDIIGIFGNEKIIGKSTNSDISEYKQTILYLYVYNYAKEYFEKLDNIYGSKKLTKKDIEQVKEIFINSKALEHANSIMNELFEKSISEISNLKIKEEYKRIIVGFIYYLKIRQK